MKIIEKYDKQFEYAGMLMHCIIAVKYYLIWNSPKTKEAELISTLAILMAFEFIMVHSGIFMSLMPKKISFYIMVPIYSIFALAFNMSMPESNIILYTYLFVVFNRMRFAFSDVSPSLKARSIAMSLFAVLSYFFILIAVVIAEGYIPSLGLTSEFLEASGYNALDNGGGLFIDRPEVALCFGLIYYTFMAFIEYKLLHWNFSKLGKKFSTPVSILKQNK
ncbi:MAG: hypothetical protein V3U92_05380 [Cellulophaga sp.]